MLGNFLGQEKSVEMSGFWDNWHPPPHYSSSLFQVPRECVHPPANGILFSQVWSQLFWNKLSLNSFGEKYTNNSLCYIFCVHKSKVLRPVREKRDSN